MLASVNDLHRCEVDGTEYWFRTPTVLDLPQMRRLLTRQGLRRPAVMEFHMAALAGIKALGDAAGEAAEAARQAGVIDEWYRLLPPLHENDIDEPDFELRAVELARLEAERSAAQMEIVAEVSAIESMLIRHWSPYSELIADRTYFDDVSQICVVRLLLMRIGGGTLNRGPDGMLTEETYLMVPAAHRDRLGAFAAALLVPSEDTKKN